MNMLRFMLLRARHLHRSPGLKMIMPATSISTCQRQHATKQPIRTLNIGKFSKADKCDPSITMVILGWAWMTDSQMDRFAKMHQDLGYNTLTCIMDAPLLFSFDYKSQMEVSETLYGQIKEAYPDTKNVFFHVFSNNGYALYQHLGDMLTKDPDVRLAGAMLDSAPSYWNFSTYVIGKRGLVKTTKLLPFAVYMYLHNQQKRRGLLATLKDAWKLWPKLRANWPAYSSVHQSPGCHLLQEKLTHPLMFMYSQGDKLMPATFIELCAQKHKDQGRTVILEDFGQSGHVAHCKSDTGRYQQAVQKFVKDCMSQRKKI